MLVPSSCHLRLVVAMLLMASTGCAWLDRDEIVPGVSRTNGVLAAARANQISMFGDLPRLSPPSEPGSAPRARVSPPSNVPPEPGPSPQAASPPLSGVSSPPGPLQPSPATSLPVARTSLPVRPSTAMPRPSPPTSPLPAAVSVVQHTFSEVGGDLDPSLEPGGRRIVFSSTRHSILPDLYVKSVDGVAVTQLTSDPSSDIQPAFSPDGRRVAFASDRTGNWDIWIVSVDGGAPVQVTDDPSDDVHPSWSPDGQQLVFCSLPVGGGEWELWTANSAAGASRRFIGYGLFPSWSPVGDTILFQRARERGSRWFSVWTITLVEGEPRYPTEVASNVREAMILPAWSRDGRRIAYASSATPSVVPDRPGLVGAEGVFDIWVMDADGRNRIRLTDGQTTYLAPTFADDGRVFFVSGRAGAENIWSLRPGTVPTPSATAGMTATEARLRDVAAQPVARPVSTRIGP